MTSFSVIIPTCNRNDMLAECLDRLKPGYQATDMFDCEIIVTDDSNGESAKVLIEKNYPWVKWVKGPARGPAANRNNGAKQATGEWLLFTDDDCLPDERWIAAFKQALAVNPTAKVFEGYTNADRPKQRFDEESPINTTGGQLWSCNFMVSAAFFSTLNGFDENFPYAAMEDTDLQVRILEHEKIVFVPDAKIIHPWRRVKPFRNYKKRLASHRYFAKKNNQYRSFSYRFSRLKIFVGDCYFFLKELASYSFKGWPVFFERLWLDILLVFT